MNDQMTLESMSQAVWYNRWTLKKFEMFLSGNILEVGCGIGNFTAGLIRYGQVYTIDINQNYLKYTKELVNGKAKVGFGDIENGTYFFNNVKFDSIVCLNVIEHIKEDEKALTNIFNLLKVGGYLVLLAPAFDFLYGEIDKSIGHFRRYQHSSLTKLLTNLGFKIIKTRVLNMLGALGWLLAGKILVKRSVGASQIKIFNLIAPLTLSLEDLIQPPFGTSLLVIARKNR